MLIALDLDGTLLDATGRLTPRSVEAVRRAVELGHRVVLATGRPPHVAIPPTLELAGLATHVVGGNGSLISTFPASADHEAELLHLIGFDIGHATAVIERLRAFDPGFGFAFATDAGFAHEHGFAELMPAAVQDAPIDDVLSVGGTMAFKLLAFHADRPVDHLLRDLPPVVADAVPPGAPPLAVTHLGADAVEIGPADTDKCGGLIWLCDHLGVARDDVIAIGDEMNDLRMLQWAGRGIAMANGHEQVREIADEVIGTNTDDGVAKFLDTLGSA